MVASHKCSLGIIFNQMLLSLEAVHRLYLLVINTCNIDELIRLVSADFRLMGLKAEEAHLLSGSQAIGENAVGVGEDAASPYQVMYRIVVRIYHGSE